MKYFLLNQKKSEKVIFYKNMEVTKLIIKSVLLKNSQFPECSKVKDINPDILE